MRVILLILFSLLSVKLSFANEKELEAEQRRYKELQQKVAEQCINNKNSGNYSVSVSDQSYNCPQLIVITDRLKKEIDQKMSKFKEECEEKNKEEALHASLAKEAVDIAEKSAECKPSPDRNNCLGKFTCSLFTAAAPLKLAMSAAGRAFGSNSMKQCAAQKNSLPGCLVNVLKGIFDSIWSSLKMIWDVGKWATKKVGELFGIVKESEAKTSERAMMAQQAGPGFLKRLATEPLTLMRELANNLYKSLQDAAINHYGCEKWSGLPFRSTCLQPMTTWHCGTCQQKTQVYCGIAGFAAGEIGTAFLTGGLVSAGKAGIKGGATVLKAAVKLGSGPSKNVASFIGRTFPKSSVKVSKAAGTVKTLASVGLSASQRKLIAGWEAMKNSRLTNTIGGLSSTMSKSVVGKASSIALKPVTLYLRAMDKAFMAGMNSVDNLAKIGTKRVIREEAIQGTKIAEEVMNGASDVSSANRTSSSGLVVESSTDASKVRSGSQGSASTQAPPKTSINSNAGVARTSDKSNTPAVKAADEVEDVSDLVRYRQDPEYAQLYKGAELYEGHHDELTMVIRAMEDVKPAMTKEAIRKKIQETLNSCQL